MNRRTFLSNLRQSGVLTENELANALRRLPDDDRGRPVARALVEMGVLTRFQAERLLAGRNTGFVMDRYVILDQIGQGGMGRVYKARHRTMNRTVALKILAPRVVQNERAQELFLREVRAVAQLVHPNIVTAYDANQASDRYYLILEYVEGPNLEQLVRTGGPLSVGLACDLIRQTANGLQCAHLRGMVHRDIKPANILVQPMGPDGQVAANAPGLAKISDFGLARLNDLSSTGETSGTIFTKPNTVMGTPDYVSPEQARNLHDTDIRSDIYSLGCTFYYLLTGKVPFPGGTSVEKLIRHSTQQPPSVTECRQDIPTEVMAILEKMMAKKPDDRFAMPSELAAALEPYSVSGPTPWHPQRPGSDPFGEAPEKSTAQTLPEDVSLTPVADDFGVLTPDSSIRKAEDRRLMKQLLLWSLALGAAVIGLIGLVLLLSHL